MKITFLKLSRLFLLLPVLLAASAYGQYTQTVTYAIAPGTNAIEKSATTLQLSTFQTAVAEAWTNGGGGVFDFPTTVTPNTTRTYNGHYGTNNARMIITSSVNMQNITAGTFAMASSPNGTTSSANQSDYTLTLSLVDNESDLPLVDEVIKQVGFIILSRNAAGYPLDLRVTATFSDNSTEVVTAPIASGLGADDTFFGFTAPGDLAITSLRFQSFVPSSDPPTPVADRIGWDDFGFITGPTAATPPPLILAVSPEPFAIHNAANGLQFEALTYVSVSQDNIGLVVNGVDVSDELIFSGESTNYSVAYNGLLPDQEYNITISVTNSGGFAQLDRTFYTTTTSLALYDSEGFTSDVLYPFGALQAVTHGRGTWLPNAEEPATIVDAGGAQGKALERLGTGASRSDFLGLPPVSSGIIIIEFDAFVSTTVARTMDVCLQPVTGGTTMASFLAWGEVPGMIAYYDNVNWIPIADIPTDWHHVKIVNYLSGIAAGRYDVIVNGVEVAKKIPWRNAPVGSVFNQFRLQTQNTAALFEFGRIDNLVISATPEDPNAALPPTIVNLTPTFVHPDAGIQFNVVSAEEIFETNIVLRFNGTPVTPNISGPSTNLSVVYAGIAEGNHSFEVEAYNSEGTNFLTQSIVATTEAWLFHPADGWANEWVWTSGMPSLQTASPIDGAYINLDTTGGARNFMREYQSGAVDITKPHYIRWKFRLNDPDFDNGFSVFNDRVHFFAHPVERVTASTTGGNSWAIMAAGGENAGAIGGKTFWLFDNVEGNGTFNLANHVDTLVPLVPGHVYAFEVLVNPEDRTYTASIVDQSPGGASFTSSAPHRFRDTNPANTHNFLHFGIQASAADEVRSFDLDSVFVEQAAASLTLLNPVHDGQNFSFSFQTQNNVNYIVQCLSDVTSSSWTSLATNLGDGNVITFTHTNAPVGPLFYRVQSQSP